MSEKTKISWTDATWNPWQGCHKVSAGCTNCYMFREKNRFGQTPDVVVRSAERTFLSPLHWKEPRKIFVCSWSDFFIEEADAWRAEAWDIIRQTPHHTYQLCTKRPERIKYCLPPDWGDGWKNVWLGVTAENQEMADLRIPILLETPAAVRWVSCEPLLGPLWLDRPLLERLVYSVTIDWVVVGGESGRDARPMQPDWARTLRDQCAAENMPFFFKQWGEWGTHSKNIQTGEPIFRSFASYEEWANKAATRVQGGRCFDRLGNELKRGTDFIFAHENDSFPVFVMDRVGKNGGDVLDGRQYHEFPKRKERRCTS